MRLYELPYYMVKCLILTILIETVIAFILGYRKKDLLNVILVNIVTNPIVTTIPVYFNVKYGVFERNIALLVLEITTLFTEGFIYLKCIERKKINPFILSLLLNLSSYGLGLIIN